MLASHVWRTAENSAAYLLPHLDTYLEGLSKEHRRHDPPRLLDVGCGPGSITIDFARILAKYKGSVVGVDPSADVIEQARETAKRLGVENVEFMVGDALNLDFEDESFDITHAHQVLQHVPDPVKVMQELRRVCKPGGITAAREAIFSAITIFPLIDGLKDWQQAWTEVAESDGGKPDAGCELVRFALDGGFRRDQIEASAGNWCYSGRDSAWWGKSWAERCRKSDFPTKAPAKGLATKDDCEKWAKAFEDWSECEDAWMGFLHGEVVCRK